MWDRLKNIESEYNEVERKLSDPDVISDGSKYQELAKEHSRLGEIVTVYRDYNGKREQLDDAKAMLADSDSDDELKSLAEAEISELNPELERLEQQLKVLLIPPDPLDDSNVIVEIRAGAGGDEAALFAGVLMRMYSRFAERQRFKAEVLTSQVTGKDGIKDATIAVEGNGAYKLLKYESGVHRVQRIPVTESSGRIHTSTATVAVLPEAEEIDIEIKNEDLEIDTFCASGPGGQHVNKTESAVRITHTPTGVVVTCQDEKSQHKNRERAMRVLRARLLDIAQAEQQAEMAEIRRTQVGTGDRSERIRTYNYPQNRVTDHRIGFTSHRLQEILDGDINELIDQTMASDRAAKLASEEG